MRFDYVTDDENDGRAGSWVTRLVPRELVLRALAVDLRGPATLTVGEPETFVLTVRNRLPIPVALTLPTSRLWGWSVEGIPEADERGFEPPAVARRVAFARRERRVFPLRWDGFVRRAGATGDEWVPQDGSCQITGFLAVDDWERRGLYDDLEVRVVP
ncbi:hypothetical protein [Halorussus halophilus]|uniref:hypothetical protein n=1 Tax=Halorussus halophilus TaxID=2650975 RepID=UPI0013018741|nr:hypothetical protein [Halorussus halophilus]